MADIEKNKFNAGGRFGDSDVLAHPLGVDGAKDFAADSAGLPASGITNKFEMGGRLGDSPPFGPVGTATGPKDFSADSAGVPSPNQGEKSDWPLAFEPNKFPREKGHDSLTEEEAQLA